MCGRRREVATAVCDAAAMESHRRGYCTIDTLYDTTNSFVRTRREAYEITIMTHIGNESNSCQDMVQSDGKWFVCSGTVLGDLRSLQDDADDSSNNWQKRPLLTHRPPR